MHEARRHKIQGEITLITGLAFFLSFNMFQLKRSGTSRENSFGGNSFLLFPQLICEIRFVDLKNLQTNYREKTSLNNINLAE